MKKNYLSFLVALFLAITVNVSAQTPITDANFNQAIATCLSTNPVDGLCSESEYGSMPSWDVSNVTDMSNAFVGKSNFNADISTWDVSSVINMHWMFVNSGFNQPIGDWDVSSVTNMNSLFYGTGFNQTIGDWDVSNVTDMVGMFEKSGFNQPIGNWDVSSVTSMLVMFKDANSFSTANYDNLLINWASLPTLQPNVNFDGGPSNYCNGESGRNTLINTHGWTITDGGLDCSSLTPLTDANIHDAVDLWYSDRTSAEATYGHISNWDTSNITNMSYLFSRKTSFNENIGNWDVSNVKDMSYMFGTTYTEISSFNQPIGNWDVSNVTDMSFMFSNSLFNQPIGDWDVSSVTTMYGMFNIANAFNQPIGSWDVSSVVTMKYMFWQANSFNQPIGSWNVSNVTDMSFIFQGVTLSIDNYDSLLNGWASLETLQPDVNFNGGSSKYCSGASARNYLINSFSWTITDGGLDCSSQTPITDANFSQAIETCLSTNPVDGLCFESEYGGMDFWEVSNVTNMSNAFENKANFNADISGWDVSNVTEMIGMFSDSQFNQNIGGWDVSNVTDMSSMFQGVTLSTVNYAFLLNGWASLETLQPDVNFNGGSSKYCNGESGRNVLINTHGWTITDGDLDCSSLTPLTDANINEAVALWVSDQATAEATYGHISNWDTSNITNMFGLFAGLDFNLPIGNWDVSNVTTMSWMFESSTFNQDIGNWDVSSVTNMSTMFENSNFNQPIGNWNVSNVTDMSSMFYGAFDFNQPIGDWDVSGVTNMSRVFMNNSYPYHNNGIIHDFSHFSQDIGNWDVSSVTTMEEMFYGAVVFNQPIGAWDVSGVTNMSGMFQGERYEFNADVEAYYSQFNQDIGNWDVSNVTNMSSMFRDSQFNQVIGNWNVGSVTNMAGMFQGASFNQDIGSWDVSNVTNMSSMFRAEWDYGGVDDFKPNPFNQNIDSWDVSNVTTMSNMFGGYPQWYASVPPPSSLSTVNYDNLLISWASLPTLQPNVIFSGGVSNFCNGETARDYIVNTYGWTINDTGKDCTNAAVNCLTVEDANGFVGISNSINLILESSEIIKGFQFDITFPDGFVFDPNDITNTGLPENFQVSSADLGGNAYRVIGFSLSNETIASGTASILTFPTLINEGTLTGDYPIPVTNVTLSDVNNLDIASLCLTNGEITVYSYPMGDANGDDAVNILDILGTVDYIFDNPPSTFYFELADVNFDDTINILDVLGVQDIILSPTATTLDNVSKASTSKSLAGENYLNITNDMFSPNTSETIEINLFNDDIVKGMEFNFVLPEGFTLNPADIVKSSRLDGFIVSAQEISENTFKVLVFSLSSATVASGTGAILNLPIIIEPEVSNAVYPIAFTDVIISDTNNTDKSTLAPNIGKITISTLGIDNEDYKNTLTLYPNPANETLYVKTNRESSYSIIDVYGKLVIKGKLEQGENKLDINNYQTGIYFLKIKNESGSIIKKVIKE
ncbi:BspA family leucine-rich repeat surface protein [Algibacter sp. 2305UL17-15]|uniref:BspA family leucine-rich repeat surface protein n=1 Tax=Algibacter sp. 2305UL17-15 TaxID=3231268 RepID=UPI00345953B8